MFLIVQYLVVLTKSSKGNDRKKLHWELGYTNRKMLLESEKVSISFISNKNTWKISNYCQNDVRMKSSILQKIKKLIFFDIFCFFMKKIKLVINIRALIRLLGILSSYLLEIWRVIFTFYGLLLLFYFVQEILQVILI